MLAAFPDFPVKARTLLVIALTFPVIAATLLVNALTFPVIAATLLVNARTFPVIAANFPAVAAGCTVVAPHFPRERTRAANTGRPRQDETPPRIHFTLSRPLRSAKLAR